MLMPSRTAFSACAQSASSAFSMPAAPSTDGQVMSSVIDLKWLSATSVIARIFSRSSLVRIGWRTSSRLVRDDAFEVEQVRPRPDDRDEAHDDLFADRIDRRVRHLGEVLLEVGEQQLRLVRQRRDRRVGAHRADRFLALRRHRRHQELQVFLGVAEGLLAIEQRQIRDRRRARPRPACPPARSASSRATACTDGSSPASP